MELLKLPWWLASRSQARDMPLPHKNKMIQQSFIFLDKVSQKTEQKLWQQGINNWNSFLSAAEIKGISKERKNYYSRHLEKAKEELYSLNSEYFLKLPQSEMWRLYGFFRDEVVFLDIETSGMGK